MYNNQFYPNTQYGQPYNYMYQNQMPQKPLQPQQEMPFKEVRYGTIDEAKAHIVMPNQSVMFINRNIGEFYVKSANNMGEPLLETFKFEKVDNLSENTQKADIDTNLFVKRDDLKDVVTKEDLKMFLTADNTKNFVTKEDIKTLADKVEALQKQIKIREILGGEQNGE